MAPVKDGARVITPTFNEIGNIPTLLDGSGVLGVRVRIAASGDRAWNPFGLSRLPLDQIHQRRYAFLTEMVSQTERDLMVTERPITFPDRASDLSRLRSREVIQKVMMLPRGRLTMNRKRSSALRSQQLTADPVGSVVTVDSALS